MCKDAGRGEVWRAGSSVEVAVLQDTMLRGGNGVGEGLVMRPDQPMGQPDG